MADKYERQILVDLYKDFLSLNYQGDVMNFEEFSRCFIQGPQNRYFCNLAAQLCLQLESCLKRQNRISIDREELHAFGNDPQHPFKAPLANPLAFLVKLKFFLNALGCPVREIMAGELSSNLSTWRGQVITVEYLVQQLLSFKMAEIKNAASKIAASKKEPFEALCELTELGKKLASGYAGLNFRPQPAFDINEYDKLVCDLSQPLSPAERVGDVLFSGVLTESQWFSLEKLYAEFFEEYRNRREMDITRISVTISSFLWKDEKKMHELIRPILDNFLANVSRDPDVEMSDMIAATAGMGIGDSVSSGAVCQNTHSTVNKVIIGDVPDRGGRPNEQAPPPPELPSWQPRSDTRPRGRSAFPVLQPSRGPYFQPGADPRNNFPRPVEIVAPMVAGDNFAQFGNSAPAGIRQQYVVRGSPMVRPGMQVPAVNVQYQPQYQPQPRWGMPPVGFAGRGGPNAFVGQGACGGPNDGYGGQVDRGRSNVFRGQNSQGGPNMGAAFGGQAWPHGGQRGPGRHMRGGRGGRGGFEGFGGFSGQN